MKRKLKIKPIFCSMLVGIMLFASPITAFATTQGTPYITTDALRFRAEPSLDARTIEMIAEGTAVLVTGFRDDGWYRVNIDGVVGYMFSRYLDPQAARIQTLVPNSTSTTSFLTTANLRLRTGPSTSAETIQTIPEGRTVQVVSTGSNGWHKVSYNGTTGYMYSEFLTNAIPSEFVTTGNVRMRTGPSLDSNIIQTIPTGNNVQVLGSRNNDWFAVQFNGTSGYMFAEFLFDSSQTPTQPTISTINGVELVEWSQMRNNILRTGVPLQITDVRTGITYWVKSFSNGNHADVEPITPQDTAAILQTFGSWSWATRPVWVTIGDRTFAASINGMPHAGSTNHNNNMNGHLCLHFLGSRTHNGSVGHERDHQNSVQEAFNAARR
jgi:uncharacterized protein YgiM (DUF1202 family)